MWLLSDLRDEWKPNRCKFVLTEQGALNRLQVTVDASYPNAWRKEPFYSKFRHWARSGRIISVFIGDRVTHLLPDGEERESTRESLQASTSGELGEIALKRLREVRGR
jgi:hypothetical protein